MLIALGKAGILGQPYLMQKDQPIIIVVTMKQQKRWKSNCHTGKILSFSPRNLLVHLNRHQYPPVD